MGYMRYHAILVTSWDSDAIERTHQCATDLVTHWDELEPQIISPVSPRVVNGYRSFAIFPDGSNESWRHSDQGDEFRQAFLDHLDSNERYEDGSGPLKWCLVQYGDENGDNRMLRYESSEISLPGEPPPPPPGTAGSGGGTNDVEGCG